MEAFENPNGIGNGPLYRGRNKCVEAGCNELAGTAWSPHWCFKHNVERMRRIDEQWKSLLTSSGSWDRG